MCGCEDPSSLGKPHKTLLEHYFHVLLAKLSSWRPNQQSTENSVENSRARTCWPGKEPSPRTATSQPGWGSSSTWSHFRPFYKQYTTFYYNWSLTEAVYNQHLLFTKYMFIKCLLWAMYRMPWLTKSSWPPARPQHDLLSVLRTRWCSRPRDHRGRSRPCRHCQGCSSSGLGATESSPPSFRFQLVRCHCSRRPQRPKTFWTAPTYCSGIFIYLMAASPIRVKFHKVGVASILFCLPFYVLITMPDPEEKLNESFYNSLNNSQERHLFRIEIPGKAWEADANTGHWEQKPAIPVGNQTKIISLPERDLSLGFKIASVIP